MMDFKGKVQTNDYKVNVLVETESSSNQHYSHLNRGVIISKVLTDDEIIELWRNRKDNDELQLAKDWIKKQPNYATSNCEDKKNNIKYQSIVNYKLITSYD